MKILILTNYDVGLYQFRREFIECLLKEHQVLIGLPEGNLVAPLQQLGCEFIPIDVDRRGINPFRDLRLLMAYHKLIRRQKPDLVIAYTVKPNIYAGLVCRWMGTAYAANITGLGTAFQKQGMLRKLVTGLYRMALKRAKVVFFENQHSMRLFLDEKIADNAQCRLLSGAGVNLEHYDERAYPTCDAETRFLFSGRVMAEKGINELFAAMQQLRRNGYNCTLDVLGQYEESYQSKVQQLERQGWLKYHGYVTDVRPYIANAHCFVLPSWHEGMANTNLECAAMARPLITSDIPGCREALVDGVSGLLCKPKDVQSLYRAMERFLQMDELSRVAMGAAGRRHMQEYFDKKQVVAETMSALNLK